MFCYCRVVFGSREDLLFQLFQLKINLTCPKLTTHLIPEILPTSEIYWGGDESSGDLCFLFVFYCKNAFGLDLKPKGLVFNIFLWSEGKRS